MKILVVDDDIHILELLKNYLLAWNYSATTCTNGREAMDLLTNQEFDILLCDWIMPEMDGIELITKARSLNSTNYLYIVILTGKEGKENLITGLEAGADDFIVKPFLKLELKVRLQSGARVIKLQRELELKNSELSKMNFELSRDLESASELQLSILPKPKLISNSILFQYKFLPSFYVAGDIFNYFEYDSENILFYALDVSGHGTRSAMLSFSLNNILNPFVDDSILIRNGKPLEPIEVLYKLNKRFSNILSDNMQFFSMIYGIYKTKEKKIELAFAGHPNPIFYSSQTKELEILGAPSSAIAMSSDPDFITRILNVTQGDKLFIYSDGITECCNPQNEFFQINNLLKTLNKNKSLDLESILTNVSNDLIEFRGTTQFDDDITLLGMEIY